MFFAPDRPRAGTIAIYEGMDRKTGHTVPARTDYDVLTNERPRMVFHAIAPEIGATAPLTAALYERTHTEMGERLYSILRAKDIERYYMSLDPLCTVWKSPIEFHSFAFA